MAQNGSSGPSTGPHQYTSAVVRCLTSTPTAHPLQASHNAPSGNLDVSAHSDQTAF